MPIDPKEGLTYLGFDPEAFEDVDAFKAAADSTYVRRELAHTDKEIGGKVFGKINGTLRNNLKGVAKELEIEGVDFETMDPTEGIKILGKSLKEKTSTLRSELDTAKKGGASTKDIAEMQAKLDAVTKERDAFGQSAKDFESKYTELDTTIKSREAKAKEDAFYKDALSAIKWSPDVSDFAKTGFETAFRQQYKPDFYEGGTRTVDKDGNIVMDPKQAQTFRKAADLAVEWAEKEKLIGEAKPAPVRKMINTTAAGLGGTPQQPVIDGPVRRVNRPATV